MDNLSTEYYVVFTCNGNEITTKTSFSYPNKDVDSVDNDDFLLLQIISDAIGKRKRELGLSQYRHIVKYATYTIGQDTFEIDIRKLNKY